MHALGCQNAVGTKVAVNGRAQIHDIHNWHQYKTRMFVNDRLHVDLRIQAIKHSIVMLEIWINQFTPNPRHDDNQIFALTTSAFELGIRFVRCLWIAKIH